MALDDLYRELILEHYSHPRNRGELADPDIKVEGANPLCGDELSIYVKLQDGKIADVRFVGRGCSISQASASMMTEQIKGKTVEEARAITNRHVADALDGLPAVKIHCSVMAEEAVKSALDDYARKNPA